MSISHAPCLSQFPTMSIPTLYTLNKSEKLASLIEAWMKELCNTGYFIILFAMIETLMDMES